MSNVQQEFGVLDLLFFMSFYININNMERSWRHTEEDDIKMEELLSNQKLIIANTQKIIDYIEKQEAAL